MTEYFRITGENLIAFDLLVQAVPEVPVYLLEQPVPSRDMSNPLTRAEVVKELGNLPLGIRGHALNRGMSKCSFLFSIQADTDVLMEQALHDLKRTLNQGLLYIESESARGQRAVLQYKMDNATQQSYKTIYYGEVQEGPSREILGAKVKHHFLDKLQLTLYMEPYWRPASKIELGSNQIYCPGLEEDGNADGLADNWVIINLPTLTMESTIVLQGFYSQKVVTRNLVGDGIQSATFVAGLSGSAVCYAWICRPAAAPSDIIVDLYDVTAAGVITSALYDTAGWNTATAKDGTSVFKRVELSTAAGIVAGNTYRMRIRNTQDTATTFYVDKTFWKWQTTTVPDEWCDHWLVYNHYDTTESAAHVGHQNYFDVADLKGTDEARLGLSVSLYGAGDYTFAADLIVARRSWWDKPSSVAARVRDVHWLEAEDADDQSQWADAAVATCSAGNCVSDAAAVSGYVEFHFEDPPAGAGQIETEYVRGRHDVFAVVYTNDPANTQYRLSYSNFSHLLWFYNPWIKQPLAAWQLINLGEINFDKFLRGGAYANEAYIRVEYAKDAADTTRLDCLWLLRKTEPEMRLHTVDIDWLGMGSYWAFYRTADFDYEDKEETTGGVPWPNVLTRGELCLRGDVLTLTPSMVVGQRLYFSDELEGANQRVWQAHGAANPCNFVVRLYYLPQYQTPLD